MREVVLPIVIATILGALGLAWRQALHARDRRWVERWLRESTRDTPHESHADIHQIAKGACITEERAVRACIANSRVFRSDADPSLWSVWRKEPQSVYEKRGVLFV